MKKFRNIQNDLFLITLLLFVLGMVNITFTLLGLICYILPFYYYYKYDRKIWCQYICPRAGMYNILMSKISLRMKTPKLFRGNTVRNFFLSYFYVSLTVVIFSTIMVSIGRVAPLEDIRFFLLFVMPFELPQLITLDAALAFIHLGYRIYSMVFTTVIIGMVLGILYQPRMWCSVCPINTLTTKKRKIIRIENSPI